MSQREPRTAGQQVYDELINCHQGDFWMYASEKGVQIMQQARLRLIEIGSGVLFSGHPERGQTCLFNSDQIQALERRIRRWEGDLEKLT